MKFTTIFFLGAVLFLVGLSLFYDPKYVYVKTDSGYLSHQYSCPFGAVVDGRRGTMFDSKGQVIPCTKAMLTTREYDVLPKFK